VHVFGIPMLGVNSATLHQLVLSVAAIAGVLAVNWFDELRRRVPVR
jgi:hypothetical protein